jgi:putative chitinase
MSITREQILSVAPDAEPYVDALLKQMRDTAITTPVRAAHFLAQFHHESAGFTRMVESLNYSVGALKTLFGRHRISEADAEKYGRKKGQPANQQMIANTLYGGKWGEENLGNILPGDGWLFRGRGFGLTGRKNYERLSRAWLGSDALLSNPGQVAEPAGAVASAIWFWHNKGLNAVADRNSVEQVTRIVNGGTNGLEERREMTQRFLKAFTS